MTFQERAAASLEETAALLSVRGENPFRIRAFEAAARAVSGYAGDLEAALAPGSDERIPGVGKGIADFLRALVADEIPEVLSDARRAVQPAILELLAVPGLGAGRIRKLHEALNIQGLGDLERAIDEGRVAKLPGFGEKSVRKIREGISFARGIRGRCLMPEGIFEMEDAVARLRAALPNRRVEGAGQARRRLETISSQAFAAEGQAQDICAAAAVLGDASVRDGIVRGRLASGRPFEIHPAAPGAFGTAWIRATGAEAHLAALAAKGPLPEAASEEAAYGALGLEWIPSEWREGRGEIAGAEAARAAGRPIRLVETGDLRGTFHVHTTESDGLSDLSEIARASAERGWEYVGISDHSRSAGYAGGLDASRLARQGNAIRALSERAGIRILHGSEVDILPDGTLDFPDEILGTLDFVVASVHGRFGMSRDEMTERILRAIRNPAVTILGHMTGRLLLEREPYAVDEERVIREAARLGVAVELNSHPSRLDIDWRRISFLLGEGGRIAIDPDAHVAEGLGDVEWGVLIARKGGVKPDDVLNARCADDAIRSRAK